MPSIFEDTNPRRLQDLLRQMHTYEMGLPNFQRNFVWKADATQELIVSIAKNFPAGSLLRIRNSDPAIFPYREFEGVKALTGAIPTYLVLDGQQRLTSLYQAFHEVGDTRFFLRIGGLINGEDFEDCLFHHAIVERKARYFSDSKVQAKDLVLPLYILGDEPAGAFAAWMFEVTQEHPDSVRRQLGDNLRRIATDWIATIDHYQFPVVTLSSRTTAEAVCTIFETVNRTGVKLTPFELLAARYFARGIDIRDLWVRACDDSRRALARRKPLGFNPGG